MDAPELGVISEIESANPESTEVEADAVREGGLAETVVQQTEINPADTYNPPQEPPVCPEPDDCETLEELSVGHGDPIATLEYNPNLNDSIAVWSRQIGGIIECVDAGETMRICVAESGATEACKSNFVELSDKNDGAEMVVFGALFLGESGPCVPEREAE